MGRGNPSDGGQVSQGDREVLRGVIEGDRKPGRLVGAQELPPFIGKGMREGEGFSDKNLLGWGMGG